MTWKLFISEMENLLEVDAGTLNQEMALDDLPSWNSMAAIGFIAWADRTQRVAVDPQDLANCKSLVALAKLVNITPGTP